MGVFPFINTETVQEAASKKLPLFREYAYDFEKHCLKLDDDGRTYLVFFTHGFVIVIPVAAIVPAVIPSAPHTSLAMSSGAPL